MPSIHASPATLFALSVMLGCATPSKDSERSKPTTGYERLVDLIEREKFDAVIPPESAFTPGAILEREKKPRHGVFMASGANVFPEESFPRGVPMEASSRAAWLSGWRYVASRSSDLSIFALFEDAAITELGAELERSGVESYRMSFGPAAIERLTVGSIVENFDQIDETYQGYLRKGYPIVLESLIVDSLEIEFLDAEDRVASVGFEALASVLGIKGENELLRLTDGHVAARGPFVLGVKTRVLDVRDGGTVVTIDLPPDLEHRRAEILRGTELLTKNADYEPNDSASDATLVSARTTVSGTVGFGDDLEDWFAFRAPADGVWTYSVENTGAKKTKQSVLRFTQIFGADGQSRLDRSVRTLVPGAKFTKPRSVSVSEGGFYFVLITPQDKNGTRHSARYRLTATFDANS